MGRYIEPIKNCIAANVIKTQKPRGRSCEMRLSRRQGTEHAVPPRQCPLFPYLPGLVFFHVYCPELCSVQHLPEFFICLHLIKINSDRFGKLHFQLLPCLLGYCLRVICTVTNLTFPCAYLRKIICKIHLSFHNLSRHKVPLCIQISSSTSDQEQLPSSYIRE